MERIVRGPLWEIWLDSQLHSYPLFQLATQIITKHILVTLSVGQAHCCDITGVEKQKSVERPPAHSILSLEHPSIALYTDPPLSPSQGGDAWPQLQSHEIPLRHRKLQREYRNPMTQTRRIPADRRRADLMELYRQGEQPSEWSSVEAL